MCVCVLLLSPVSACNRREFISYSSCLCVRMFPVPRRPVLSVLQAISFEFLAPPYRPHECWLKPGAIPDPPVLLPQDAQIKVPRLAKGMSIVDLANRLPAFRPLMPQGPGYPQAGGLHPLLSHGVDMVNSTGGVMPSSILRRTGGGDALYTGGPGFSGAYGDHGYRARQMVPAGTAPPHPAYPGHGVAHAYPGYGPGPGRGAPGPYGGAGAGAGAGASMGMGMGRGMGMGMVGMSLGAGLAGAYRPPAPYSQPGGPYAGGGGPGYPGGSGGLLPLPYPGGDRAPHPGPGPAPYYSHPGAGPPYGRPGDREYQAPGRSGGGGYFRQ